MRESGYYWVKYNDKWLVCYYNKNFCHWLQIDSHNRLMDMMLQEINENKIQMK